MPQREVSTTRNPMPYNPRSVFPLPKVPTSRNQRTNPIPYYPWTMLAPPTHSISRYQVPSLMSYQPGNVFPLSHVHIPRNLTRNPIPDNPGTLMPLPNVHTSLKQVGNSMLYNSRSVVPQHMQPDSSTLTNDCKIDKPSVSNMQLIVDALLASEQYKLVLPDIYKSIMDKYEYYRITKRNDDVWRGGIRQVLSANDSFHMVGKSDLSKGQFWAIHHSCVEYFKKGNYTQREANHIVQQWYKQNRLTKQTANEPSSSQTTNGTIPDSPPTMTVSTQKQNAPATSP